jgi:capsular polysaccharide transport system ATP-binding protein
MIELRNVTKSYPVKSGQRYILRNVSLVIPDRLNIAVLGPNGAGKSTFLRLIGGVESADSGTIISDSDVSWPLGLTSGFQGSLTGRQNVLFVCSINGLRSAQISDVTNQVIDFAEIGEYFDMPVNTYSSGMRARLSFGLSMAFQFDVYLVDELTSVGDAIFREKAKAAFEKIRKRASLIFVSHNLKTLRESCQSALFLRDGIADFYPHIEDGISAYQEYINSHRNHGLPVGGKERDNPKNQNTNSDQQARKLAQKQARKQARKQAQKLAQKQAHKIARARKKADDASPPTNLP